MHIKLFRLMPLKDRVLGSVWLAGAHGNPDAWECYSKEPGLPRADGLYVPGESTAPAGRYNVSLVFSRRFSRLLPLAVCTGTSDGARPRVGLYIHPGHHVLDVEGCIVLGQAQLANNVGRTKAAADTLIAKITAAIDRGEAVDLEII